MLFNLIFIIHLFLSLSHGTYVEGTLNLL